MYVLANDSDGAMAKEFIKYVNIGLKSDIINPQLHNMGKQIGKNIKDQEALGLLGESKLATDFELIKQGFVNGLNGYEEQMTGEEAGQYIQNTLSNLKYGNVKEQGEQFLAENKLKDGVIETESGLQYEVIKMGKGAKPSATDRVKVHYHGTLIDGTVFDSSVERGEPIVFGLNQVIAGWTEGVQLMPVGSKFRFFIPQELAYGAREAGSIPPYSTLIFEVELLGIEK
ncbi:MAG: FKBP-type peptidyl-prolyl cis-trans isomerase [Paludibacteraceae bacterium]|nr:FKBP-type peptidyl-prolyl cis-trans isomerase [Paludibacteraceae bacterium]